MYYAKESERDNYKFFKQDMNARAIERQFLEGGLRQAMEKHEFLLHYQPKINLSTGAITGAEALLRWMHPTRGSIPPAKFIPVAEESGLMLPIGAWFLREAFKEAKVYIDSGLSITIIAINISAMEFRNENFLKNLLAIISETGLNSKIVELELIESVLIQRIESALSILQTLREKGVRVAVDNFGTGYSSLLSVSKFPIDAIKIDQAFIRQPSTFGHDAVIVPAIIDMARRLKLQVVAKGVETLKELEYLQAHQCDEAQGYYFSKPVTAEEFAELLRRQAA
jgi:EAL domain-containing protein (putative c-di-GMP-specific phosphodiesterase class I)